MRVAFAVLFSGKHNIIIAAKPHPESARQLQRLLGAFQLRSNGNVR